jgi:hypothetical protein
VWPGRVTRSAPSPRPAHCTPRPPCSPRVGLIQGPASLASSAPPPAFLQYSARMTVQAKPRQIAWLSAPCKSERTGAQTGNDQGNASNRVRVTDRARR